MAAGSRKKRAAELAAPLKLLPEHSVHAVTRMGPAAMPADGPAEMPAAVAVGVAMTVAMPTTDQDNVCGRINRLQRQGRSRTCKKTSDSQSE